MLYLGEIESDVTKWFGFNKERAYICLFVFSSCATVTGSMWSRISPKQSSGRLCTEQSSSILANWKRENKLEIKYDDGDLVRSGGIFLEEESKGNEGLCRRVQDGDICNK